MGLSVERCGDKDEKDEGKYGDQVKISERVKSLVRAQNRSPLESSRALEWSANSAKASKNSNRDPLKKLR